MLLTDTVANGVNVANCDTVNTTGVLAAASCCPIAGILTLIADRVASVDAPDGKADEETAVLHSRVPDGFTLTLTNEPPPALDNPTRTLRDTVAIIPDAIGAESVRTCGDNAFV